MRLNPSIRCLIHQFPGEDGTPVLIAIAGPHLWRMKSATKLGSLYERMKILITLMLHILRTKEKTFFGRKIYEFKNHMDVQEPNGSNLKSHRRWSISLGELPK